MSEPKSLPDWERIEIGYRAGILSLREIAAADGNVTEGAIRKRAKRDSWTRDLSAKIKSRADELVRKDEVRKAVRTERTVAVAEAIEISALALADVKIGRKTRVVRAQTLAEKLRNELEAMTDNAELFEDFGEMMRAPDARGQDRKNDTYQAVVSFPVRVKAMKDLTDVERALFAMEAEAFGIATGGEAGNSTPSTAAPDKAADPQAHYAWLTKQGSK